jgi:hypothetical protein
MLADDVEGLNEWLIDVGVINREMVTVVASARTNAFHGDLLVVVVSGALIIDSDMIAT